MSAFKYVVLGGGAASGYAARSFVQKGIQPGKLCIVTSEPVVAYERPALSKAYLFPEKPARLPGFHTTVGLGGDKQEPSWYKDKGIEYKVSTKVSKADLASRSLTLDPAETLTYETLIIATGCEPVTLADFKTAGADLKGIYYLRNKVDADILLEGIQQCKEKDGKVVVVGGGYIGMECAAGLALHGLDVTMVFPEPYMMSRLFTPKIAQYYEDYYAKKNIKIIKGQLVTALSGENGEVKTATIKDGTTLPASLVVVGTGARPATSLFKDQLKMDDAGGILVDGSFKTSNPDVYAVGDVAKFPLKSYGGKLQRQEHITNARFSAMHAVEAIYGSQEAYDYLPLFYSREFELSWQFYGVNEGEPVEFGDFSSGKFGCYWVSEGKVVGAFLESGSGDENEALKKLAKAKPSAPSIEDLKQKGVGFALASK